MGILKVKDLLCKQDVQLGELIDTGEVQLKPILWMGPNAKLHMVAKAFRFAGTQFGLVCSSAEAAKAKDS